MCGLFAYRGPGAPDPDLLVAAARAAAARGPHGHGWAIPGAPAHRALGPLDPEQLRPVTAAAVIGHARLATRGDSRDLAGVQPAEAGGHLVAHNGTIRNHTSWDPDAASDTVALARAYAAHRAPTTGPPQALSAALAPAVTRAWALLVLDAQGPLVAWRHDLPLWHLAHTTGTYFASRRFHPDARPLPDNTLHLEAT
ncbi:hypothetical protein OG896_24660 [Streptomyces sp. NBC_00669]|uniref:hypothetical protein n=1 Tax=Streptomyces sp. NBC_00669 TaxID=2976011 RepID=UPI002E30186C|nr:hypothetical protein [Streptomyces sp. NBC_00669]